MRSDLPPVSRTTVKFVESITMENDGHEDESIVGADRKLTRGVGQPVGFVRLVERKAS